MVGYILMGRVCAMPCCVLCWSNINLAVVLSNATRSKGVDE
jgi:hypothetical protein